MSRYRRRTRRRRPRRRRRKRRRYGLRTRVTQGLPDSLMVTLTYGFQFVTTEIAISNLEQLRGNSCFDPDFTGIGHQPHYFDQYAAFYGRYMVYSSSVALKMRNNTTTAVTVGLWPSVDSSTVVSNGDSLREQPYVRTRLLAPGDGAAIVRLNHRMTTSKMRGGTVFSDEWGALISANPSRQWYWNIFQVSPSGDAVGVVTTGILKLRVRFYKRSQVGGS